jgi:hypothetical protein
VWEPHVFGSLILESHFLTRGSRLVISHFCLWIVELRVNSGVKQVGIRVETRWVGFGKNPDRIEFLFCSQTFSIITIISSSKSQTRSNSQPHSLCKRKLTPSPTQFPPRVNSLPLLGKLATSFTELPQVKTLPVSYSLLQISYFCSSSSFAAVSLESNRR